MGRAETIEAEFPPGVAMPPELRALCDYLDRTGYPLSGYTRLRPEGDALKGRFGGCGRGRGAWWRGGGVGAARGGGGGCWGRSSVCFAPCCGWWGGGCLLCIR